MKNYIKITHNQLHKCTDKMNNTITFIDKENMEDSVLYIPVKSFVPLIFPNILTIKEGVESEFNKPQSN